MSHLSCWRHVTKCHMSLTLLPSISLRWHTTILTKIWELILKYNRWSSKFLHFKISFVIWVGIWFFKFQFGIWFGICLVYAQYTNMTKKLGHDWKFLIRFYLFWCVCSIQKIWYMNWYTAFLVYHWYVQYHRLQEMNINFLTGMWMVCDIMVYI